MDLAVLQISASSYRTTNPPISESRSLTVLKEASPFGEPRFLFRVSESYNADERRAEYPLTRTQYDEIVGLFERLRLKEALFARLNEQSAPVMLPPQVGGSSRTVLSFTANGVTMTTGDPPQEMFELTQHLQKLRNAFVRDDPSMQNEPAPPMPGFAGAPVFTPAPPPQPDRPLAEGEWFCPTCGQRNGGAFCSECGTPK